MPAGILGIHHVTAIATDPRKNLEFYRDVLGLRLVKKTVNFDDPSTYHLYYGDDDGRPGTIMTIFPWPHARRGRRGVGQVTVTSFSVPEGSLDWWRRRLEKAGAPVEDPKERFEKAVLSLLDPDGLKLELVAEGGDSEGSPRQESSVPEDYGISGLYSVTLAQRKLEETADLLTGELGFSLVGESGTRFRFSTGEAGDRAVTLDIICSPKTEPGSISAGTVHHVAWRVAGDEEQLSFRQRLAARGLSVTRVLDRNYFKSIYFREPGGVLFEIATDSPGFAVDEPIEHLGRDLKLPSWLERRRAEIEATLPPLAGEASSRRPGQPA